MALLCSVLIARSPFPSDPNAPSFRSAVNRATVPVIVRDREGRAVRGLPKEAFELLDEGRPQQIVSFFARDRARGVPESFHRLCVR